MMADAAPALCETDGPTGGLEGLRARQMARLERLAEIAMAAAELLARRIAAANAADAAAAASGDEGVADPAKAAAEADLLARALSRIHRALRLTTLLQQRLEAALAPVAGGGGGGGSQGSDGDTPPDPALYAVRENRKIRTVRLIGRHACKERNDLEALERLVQEAAERLEDEDLQGLIMTLPLGELVRRVARDIGLQADWPGLDANLWTACELMPPGRTDEVAPDVGPPRRQTCLDRPDPVLATKKGPGPPPLILINRLVKPPKWEADPVPDG